VTTVFSETRCADDARETVNEWCNDAWPRTTVVAPRRDNTYTGDDCSSPMLFQGIASLGSGLGSVAGTAADGDAELAPKCCCRRLGRA
jgi:hypothetical protein